MKRALFSNQQGSIAGWVAAIFAAVLLTGGAVWYWQETTIDDLQSEVANLKNQTDTNDQSTDDTSQQENYQYVSQKGVTIEVYSPQQNASVTSPLAIVGQVPGNWSFEADFPVELVDANGETIDQAVAQLQGDWMTEQLVPFVANLEFESSLSSGVSLILHKDNPSGLEENDDSVVIPLTFNTP